MAKPYPNCYVVQFNPSTLEVPVHTEDDTLKALCYNMCSIGFGSGVLDCDDDQTLTDLNDWFCLEQIADFQWEGSVTINGDDCVIYFDLTGVISVEYCTVYSEDNVYFHTGAAAGYPYSELVKADCGTSFRVDRDLVFRTVKAYGGQYIGGCS